MENSEKNDDLSWLNCVLLEKDLFTAIPRLFPIKILQNLILCKARYQ